MEFRVIQGVREGSKLLHVLPEDMLYVLKCTRNGVKEWICYQTILSSPKKKTNNIEIKCSARIKEFPDGTFQMGKRHECHQNHRQLRSDMEKRNNMKSSCSTAQSLYTEDAHKLPQRHIFQREISK